MNGNGSGGADVEAAKHAALGDRHHQLAHHHLGWDAFALVAKDETGHWRVYDMTATKEALPVDGLDGRSALLDEDGR